MTYYNKTFSRSVPEATEKFIEACFSVGARVEKFKHPLHDPSDNSLYTTVGWLGPEDAKNVLLIVSGTHGNEGWAGSAIQIDAIKNGAFANLPTDTAIMMIHLINPWGCAWGRRENEDNADLFRDFVYYKKELQTNDDLFTGEVLEALSVNGSMELADKKLKAFIDRNGEKKLFQIMRAGQFRHPNAPCYNGGGITWSYRLYRYLVTQYLTDTKTVLCLDIHTAFGEYGQGILISYGSDQERMNIIKGIYGDKNTFFGGFNEHIPPHPREPFEIAEDIIPDLTVVAVAFEFGTYEWVNAIGLLKYMNYLFTSGDIQKPERPDLVRQYNSLCYPDKDDWRELVIIRSREVIQQAINGFSQINPIKRK